MSSRLHRDFRVQKLTIGEEKAPLLVIDNFAAQADELRSLALSKTYTQPTRYYPGIRAKAPLSYQQLVLDELRELLLDCLGVSGGRPRFSMCHFSLVTTPADQLQPLQRVPHFDSLSRYGLATVHYLFHEDLGGTAFYRHRSTGFEYVDESRQEKYFAALQAEADAGQVPASGYINGDTALFQQIAKQDGVFNRMLIYWRNCLHSGAIAEQFVPDANPATGRLSINSFIDIE